ncbi:vacuolar-sorting protein snf7 [Sodiomyces alkalinus F11]|uniref:Vacuolar-sorting protein SNF7 n=1 Tax=Sodiomyces alkalinus (strain CBS 110278 / VKM F-3762 / F11) TaxID=1314773 RepID=A0A3N2Q3Q1_SODAK|nr:vacuolar-sorting protein snf7 [Sodiomyces alkalinus F11]ROT41347.1 vacuolar-sorting protein snf7 [Sodiomyces alkalinus F11]
MSSWLSWWGGAANQKQKQAKVKEAVVGLRAHKDMLEKKAAYLQTQVDELEAQTKAALKRDPNEAKRLVARKLRKEKERQQVVNSIQSMESQEMALNRATATRDEVQATQKVTDAMKLINKDISVDKVDAMMESLREQNAANEEIAQMLGTPVGDMQDEDELEEELERMRQEQVDEEMLKTGTVPVSDKIKDLPSAATGELKRKTAPQESEEEAELRRLQAEMAM